MGFLRRFLRNLIFFAVVGIIIYLMEPEMVKNVVDAYWQILGPIGLLLIIVGAIPQKRRRRR
jgi:hypothetical protein